MPLASRVLEAELDPAPQAEVVRTPESGSWWWTALAPVVFGLLVYAPWLRSGRLFAYDWISGPYDRVPPATFGLREGRASVAPVVIARRLLGPLLGGVDPVAVALVLSPLLLAWGLRGLLGRSPRAWLPALALAAINPYLYQHLSAGAFGLVLAASMLPLGWSLAIRTLAGERAAALKLALTVAVQTAFAPQYVLFGLIPIGALVVVRVLRSTSRRRPGSPLGVVLVAGCLSALSAY